MHTCCKRAGNYVLSTLHELLVQTGCGNDESIERRMSKKATCTGRSISNEEALVSGKKKPPIVTPNHSLISAIENANRHGSLLLSLGLCLG